MTEDATDLLAEILDDHASAEVLPSVAEICALFERGLEQQQDIYEQILLPRLGLGERLDLAPHKVETGRNQWSFRGGEIWLFDGRPQASWLHAPLLIPFEDIDDTLLLVRRADVPTNTAARLRPPIVPTVRQALESLDWLVADTGGYEGGRMEHAEFLDEIGQHCWYRIDHDPATGAARLETWQGEEPVDGWSTNVPNTFEFGHSGSPVVTHGVEDWLEDVGELPFEAAVAIDQLEDPYALLRRLLWHDVRLDIDRLGPLVTWKDSPDVLFGFRDDEDSLLADLPAWMSVELDAPEGELRAVVDAWFDLICERAPVELDGVGFVHPVHIPGVSLPRPRPMVDGVRAGLADLRAQTVYAASARPGASWLDTE
ncbi:MAG: hypothetical protein ACLFVJ_09450 [Persicimonas sp.]